MQKDWISLPYRLRRFDTDEWPAETRIQAWREVLSGKLLRSEVKELDGHALHVEAYLRMLPGIAFGWGTLSPSLHRRPRDIIAEDNDDFFLVVNMAGSFVAIQRGREVSLEPGEAAILSCSEISAYMCPERCRILCFRLPSLPLLKLVPDAYDRVASPIAREAEPLKLLTESALGHRGGHSLATEELVARAADEIVALVALTLGASRESREQLQRKSLDPLRLAAIKDYVQANAVREDLSVGEVAQKHGMSARHVQRLFEAAGLTFSEFVLRERLALVYLTMTDPSNLDRRISDIIFDAGFTDISHFNRAFRRRYGAPPSELRRQLKRGDDLPN